MDELRQVLSKLNLVELQLVLHFVEWLEKEQIEGDLTSS